MLTTRRSISERRAKQTPGREGRRRRLDAAQSPPAAERDSPERQTLRLSPSRGSLRRSAAPTVQPRDGAGLGGPPVATESTGSAPSMDSIIDRYLRPGRSSVSCKVISSCNGDPSSARLPDAYLIKEADARSSRRIQLKRHRATR